MHGVNPKGQRCESHPAIDCFLWPVIFKHQMFVHGRLSEPYHFWWSISMNLALPKGVAASMVFQSFSTCLLHRPFAGANQRWAFPRWLPPRINQLMDWLSGMTKLVMSQAGKPGKGVNASSIHGCFWPNRITIYLVKNGGWILIPLSCRPFKKCMIIPIVILVIPSHKHWSHLVVIPSWQNHCHEPLVIIDHCP